VRPCAGIALLHGPPGTGKTRTLVGTVSALLLCRPTPRILVCTPSNAAVDELAMRLHSGLLAADGSEVGMRPGELVRVGPLDQVASRAHPLTLDALTEHRLGKLAGGAVGAGVGGAGVGGAAGVRGAGARGAGARGVGAGGAARGGDAEARERRGVLKSAQVVAATTAAAGAAFLASLEFDAVVIDEAAQASESAALVPLMNQGAAVKRVILAGDHRQLPATAHGLDPAKRQAYETSLFERLQAGGEGRRDRHPVVSLTEQHRMHRQIAEFPAKHFYGGQLDNAPSAPSRSPFLFRGGGGGGDEGDGGGGGGGSGGDGMTLSDGQATVSSGEYIIHLAPYVFLDWRGAEQSGARGASRRSISNPSEAHVA
jgi:senataxin